MLAAFDHQQGVAWPACREQTAEGGSATQRGEDDPAGVYINRLMSYTPEYILSGDDGAALTCSVSLCMGPKTKPFYTKHVDMYSLV